MGRQLKDSGVEWIGEIPEDWEVRKLNALSETITDFVASGSFKSLSDNVEYLDTPDYARLIRTVDLSESTNRNPVYINKHAYEFLSNSNLYGGELILSNIGSVGRVFMYEPLYDRASLAPNAIMLRMKENNRFYYFWFKNPLVTQALKQIGSGTVQTKFNKTQLRSFSAVRPPLSSQIKIATFLDEKTLHIDSIIGKTKASIDAFKRYKQALITETVTKGLNPDVSMKDSGIGWIGLIPEHWGLRRMKSLGTSRNGLTYSPDDLVDINEGTLVLRSSNVQNGELYLEDNVYVSKNINPNLLVEKGDILVCSRNGSRNLIGKSAIIDTDINASFGAFMMIFKPNQNPKYLYYILNSEMFKYYLGTFLTSTINQLTKNNFQNMKVVFCPDPIEQQEIAAVLDEKTAHIDSLIQNKEAMIEKLEAYKKSLIYEYVTGKKEVE